MLNYKLNKMKTNNKTKKLTYQEFILNVLSLVDNKLTKEEMQFSYVFLYQGLGLSIKESIKLSKEL